MKRIFPLLLSALLLSGCGPQTPAPSTDAAPQDTASTQAYTTEFFAMDTYSTVKIYGDEGQDLGTQCMQLVNQMERELSRTRSDTEVWALNHANGAPVAVSASTAELIDKAITLAAQTDGAFDPTIAAVVDAWRFGTEEAAVPTPQALETALATVGYPHVQRARQTVTLSNGAQIDLGGIAKGEAANRCAALIRDANTSGLVVLGGNVYAVGDKQGEPWIIGLANPDNSSDYLATFAVRDCSVVSSGDYERYFEQDGVIYHHIFDPQTGYPAQSDLRGVTILHEDSAYADALCTALYVMGLDKARAYCAQNGLAAAFISRDNIVYTSDALSERCTFTFLGEEKGYTYAQ